MGSPPSLPTVQLTTALSNPATAVTDVGAAGAVAAAPATALPIVPRVASAVSDSTLASALRRKIRPRDISPLLPLR